MKYYYKAYGRENGPEYLEEIKRFAWVNHSGSASKNAISGDTLVRAENSTEWVKLSEVQGLKGVVPTQKEQSSTLAVPIMAQDDASTSAPDVLRMTQTDSSPIELQPTPLILSIQSSTSPRQTGEYQQEQYQVPEQQLHSQLVTPAPTSEDEWIFKPKSISTFKWFLSANPWKSYQLDLAQRKGDVVTIAVRSGKCLNLRIGTFKVKISKNRKTQGIRDFHVKTIKGIKPKQKITFRESQWQMPEEDWDQLAQKLEASDMAISKIANSALNILEKVKKNI